MTRWPKLYEMLTGSSRSQPCADGERAARTQALAKLEDAEKRGDTRDQGRALMQLRQATHDLLRAERGMAR